MEIFYKPIWGIAVDLNGIIPFIFISIAGCICCLLFACGAIIAAAMFGSVTKSIKSIRDGQIGEIYTLIVSIGMLILGILFMIFMSNVTCRIIYNILNTFYI